MEIEIISGKTSDMFPDRLSGTSQFEIFKNLKSEAH